MTSRKNIKIFYFNRVNVTKHWHVAGRGICHLRLPVYMYVYVSFTYPDTSHKSIVIDTIHQLTRYACSGKLLLEQQLY